MTEYWVSQGNKWCDFCKIYIANNPLSIRTHELGQRHKDNVAQRIASIRKENAAKEKEEKDAARALEQIEAKAKRSYQKDLKTFQDTRESNANALEAHEDGPNTTNCSMASSDGNNEWEYDSASGYYYNRANGCHYDPNSGFYFSSVLGKWVTQEEAFATSQVSSERVSMKPSTSSVAAAAAAAEDKHVAKHRSGSPPGLVVAASPNPMRSIKGASSSIAVNKRKRGDEKPKVISKEEATALKAREAAKKRVEKREKPLLGLYKSY